MRLKFFVQNESLEELEKDVNDWIEEMEKKGGVYKGNNFTYDASQGMSIVIEWEEKKG